MAVITVEERKRIDAKEQQRLKQLTTIDKLIDRVGTIEHRLELLGRIVLKLTKRIDGDTKIIEGDYADVVEPADALGFNGKPVVGGCLDITNVEKIIDSVELTDKGYKDKPVACDCDCDTPGDVTVTIGSVDDCDGKPITPDKARDKLQANYDVELDDDPIAHLPPDERDNIING